MKGPQQLHLQMYLAYNEVRDTAETFDKTLRTAVDEVLPAMRLFATWVEEIEPHPGVSWIATNNLCAQRGLDHVLALVQALRRTKAGKLTGLRLMQVAAQTRIALKNELGIGDPDGLKRLEYDERRRPRPKDPNFLDAYRYNKAAGNYLLRPRYDPSAPEDPDAEFRRLHGRRRGRPKQYRDELKTVLAAVEKAPAGITVDALCKATKMRRQAVTDAYKKLLEDDAIRTERRGPRRQIFLFPKSKP